MKAPAPPTIRLLAPLGVAVYLILTTIGLTLLALTQTAFSGFSLAILVPFYLVLGIWVAIGALIVWHHPQNRLGWLLSLFMPSVALDLVAMGYLAYETTGNASTLLGSAALLWLKWTGMPFGMLMTAIALLLFPNGRFRSARWRAAGWLAVAAFLAYLPLKASEPGPINFVPDRSSPIAVSEVRWALMGPLMWLALITLTLCMAAGLLSLILRLRRARGDERQQIKWLVAPAALFLLGIPVLLYGEYVADPFFRLGGAMHMIAVSGMMIAMAIAIFRYRLYDIDIIIHRTLVYSSLTVLLALIYFSTVLFFEQALRFVTGQESQLSIVVSTLLIAALFSPLRQRVQNFIDRRFYRRKYSAEMTLAAFAATTRDVVDLEQLTAELLSAVEETMQPESTSLWLHEGDLHRSERRKARTSV